MKHHIKGITLTAILFFAVGTAQAQWSSAVQETLTLGPENDQISAKSLGLDNQGKLHVLFDRIDSSGHNLFYMAKPVDGEWSEPVAVGDHNLVQSSGQLAVHQPSGIIYVVFFQGFDLKLGLFDGNNWEYHLLSIPAPYSTGDPDIVLDAAGRAHISLIAHNDSTEFWHIGYGYWDGSNDFHFQTVDGSLLYESSLFALPRIAVKSDGSVAIAYLNFWHAQDLRMEVSENSGLGAGEWSHEEVGLAGFNCYTGAIAATPDDDLHLLLQTYLTIPFPGQIFYRKKEAGSLYWEAPVIASGTQNCRHPRMVVQANGVVHIVCHQTQGLYSTGNLLYLTNQGGDWSQSFLIQGQAFDPSFQLDEAGNGSIVFRHQIDILTDNDIYYYGYVEPQGTNPQISIVLSPQGTPIQIPAGGGSFNYDISAANSDSTPVTFDTWIMAQLPNQSWYGPLLGPINLTLPGNGSLNRLRTQVVPTGAPSGSYLYEGRVGSYPNSIWDSDSFAFSKAAALVWSPWAREWQNTGEPLETEETARSTGSLPVSSRPNPFNGLTALSYQLSADSYVSLRIYDATGRLVETLVAGWRAAGSHQLTFDASRLPSGMYVAKLQAGEYVGVQKLILLK